MKKISTFEQRNLAGGATYIECFFAGALFGAAIATGQLIGAAGAGFYIAANCLN